ncbi:MAG TPA: MmgE/PrpD family protein [Solirubrobacterales bacterium]|nr:MmgE/PrpD family protein [Solirubrobacterales bacterium]
MPSSSAPEEALLDLVAGLRFEDLPGSAVEATAALVLDQFSCCLIGMEMDWTRRLRGVVAPAGAAAPGASAVIYGDPTPVSAEVAALVNGTAGHGFDFDDLHLPTMSHPGCVVIPAAIAVALERGADGRALLAAVAAGYEPMLRTGLAAGLRYGELGFHATGVLGPLGSAVAAARLLGAPAVDALGLAASMGAGVKAFNEVGPGMVKRLHAGRAAEAGVLAARLAAAGYEGPRRALTARFGLARVLAMGEEPDVGALGRALGAPFLVEDIYIKPYAACGGVHGAVRAAELLYEERPLREEEIASVTVGVPPRAIAQNSNPEPVDLMAAQYSTEVSVAIALLGGATDPDRFVAAGADADDPSRRLARRIALELDPAAEAAYPDPVEGSVEVRLTSGETLSRRAGSSPATSRGWDVAAAKFEAVAESRLSPEHRRELLGAVEALAEGGSVADCLAPMFA